VAQIVSQKNRGVVVVYINESKLLDERLINEVGVALIAALNTVENEMLLVNFQGVRFMSSSMIGRIVTLYKKCKADKINLKLSNISDEIMEVFTLMNLHKLLSICADESDAMVAFEKDGWLK
jgi:anti-anti-sigma factor|tara:strand:- start:784 stop:1149 length:366 start_codon:yes stop_codon:yes gene_type:complete